MALANATFAEVLEHCGIDLEVFDLAEVQLPEIQTMIDRQISYARADVRRGVGAGVYEQTEDADKALQIRSAELYLAGAKILLALLNRELWGSGPPTLKADPGEIREAIKGFKGEAADAIAAAQREEPTAPSKWGFAQTNMTSADTRAAQFTRDREW